MQITFYGERYRHTGWVYDSEQVMLIVKACKMAVLAIYNKIKSNYTEREELQISLCAKRIVQITQAKAMLTNAKLYLHKEVSENGHTSKNRKMVFS